MISKFFCFFDSRERWLLLGQLLLVFIGSGLEILGVGVIVPFIAMLSNPSIIQEHSVLSKIYTTFQFSSNQSFLAASSFALMAIFIVKNVYLYIAQFVQAQFFANKTVKLESYLLAGYLSQPYAFYFKHSKSEMLNIVLKGVATFIDRFTRPILILVAEITTVTGILLFLVFLEPMPMLITLSVIGLFVFFFLYTIQRKLVIAGEEMYFFQQNTIKWINQSIDSVKENRVFCKLQYFMERYREYAFKNAKISVYVSMINFAPRLLIETFVFVGILGFVASILLSGIDTKTILPMLALLGVAAVRILPSITKIMTAVIMIKQSTYVVQEMYEQLKMAENINEQGVNEGKKQKISFDQKVELKNINYTYAGTSSLAVSSIDLTINRGQSVAFIGASGSGKSTLVDILLGLLELDSGEFLVDGVKISEENITSWREKIGYIPQSIYLLDATLRENIAFGLKNDEIDDERVWLSLKIAQLDSFVKDLPQQLETVTGENGILLSGGQKQRIGIARALYHDPEILIFDEATSALDNETEKELNEAIESLMGQKTLIIVAHRMSTVKKCDNLFLLRDGMIIDSGTFNQLLSGSQEFRTLSKLSVAN
ncbi:MAG: ABC transporter ATP-binding protein [Crocinitomicaceae bacterium]|nr:ABC transporter ATP-binding protein [Crocinitomicaceae bacterium]